MGRRHDRPDDAAARTIAAAAMGLAQAATAFPLRILPLLAPVLLLNAGAPVSAIGYLASVAMLGAMVGSLATGALCARFGSRRSLLLAMALASCAALLHRGATLMAFAIASLLAGVADGLTPAAGNSLLQRATSVHEQQRLFALKMIGGPVGGLAASLLLPRIASTSLTWGAPLVAAGVTAIVGVLLVASKGRWPDEVPREAAAGKVADNASMGLALLARRRELRSIAALGFVLAFSHGVWYAYFVVFVVADVGVPLVTAGMLMSIALGAGIVARLTFGFVAHRFARPDQLLGALCVGSAAPWFALSGFDSRDGLWIGVLIAAAFGATLGGWLGVQQAEISRRAPAEHVDRVSGAAAFLMFVALTLSGACFALLQDAVGGSRIGFRILAVAALFSGVIALLPRRATAS
jgi:MFS family permease